MSLAKAYGHALNTSATAARRYFSGNDGQRRSRECKPGDQHGPADGFQHFDMSGGAAGEIGKGGARHKT